MPSKLPPKREAESPRIREARMKRLSRSILHAKKVLDSDIGENLVFLVEAVRNTVGCTRDYDDDAVACIECAHYGLCSAVRPFVWILG